jgi:thimet oligopeptidase
MAQTYRAAEARFTAVADAVAAIPADQRTFANSIKPLHDAEAAYADALRPLTFMAKVSPDQKVRRMAEAIKARSNRYSLGYADRDDIYQAYKDVAAEREPLIGEDAKLLKDSLDAYKRSGMDLPMTERVNLKAIRQRLAELSQAFGKNLADYEDGLDLDPEQLKGLPEDYIKGLTQNKDGKLHVGLDYPSYVPFMRHAKDPELRRQLYYKFNNRATDKNLPLLEETLSLREKLARILGYQDYAHLAISESMAKAPETVMAFLNRIKDMLLGPARQEKAALLELKRKEFAAAQTLEEWDFGYYANKLRKQRYEFDTEEVRQYFPVDTVIKGTLDVYQELLGLKFQELPAQAWHPDIRLFEIKDAKNGRSIAYFYLDLHPRPHKYNHAMASTIIQGRELPDGSYRKPVSAVVANFSKPTPEKPALLTHGEVETFFHELGHIMHQTLTRAKYTSHSGTNVALDFVEAPSQMMENFVWRPEVLERISGHYKDPSKKLPPELLEKMLAAKNFNGAANALHQAVLAAMDQAFHSLPAPVDTTAVMAKVYQAFGLPAPPVGTHHQASFGHLMAGYQAGYYSYLWSKVFAQDIFSRFAEAGGLSPKVGMEYRRKILERGSSRDEAESMRDFLSREPDERAFVKDLGVEPRS